MVEPDPGNSRLSHGGKALQARHADVLPDQSDLLDAGLHAVGKGAAGHFRDRDIAVPERNGGVRRHHRSRSHLSRALAGHADLSVPGLSADRPARAGGQADSRHQGFRRHAHRDRQAHQRQDGRVLQAGRQRRERAQGTRQGLREESRRQRRQQLRDLGREGRLVQEALSLAPDRRRVLRVGRRRLSQADVGRGRQEAKLFKTESGKFELARPTSKNMPTSSMPSSALPKERVGFPQWLAPKYSGEGDLFLVTPKTPMHAEGRSANIPHAISIYQPVSGGRNQMFLEMHPQGGAAARGIKNGDLVRIKSEHRLDHGRACTSRRRRGPIRSCCPSASAIGRTAAGPRIAARTRAPSSRTFPTRSRASPATTRRW